MYHRAALDGRCGWPPPRPHQTPSPLSPPAVIAEPLTVAPRLPLLLVAPYNLDLEHGNSPPFPSTSSSSHTCRWTSPPPSPRPLVGFVAPSVLAAAITRAQRTLNGHSPLVEAVATNLRPQLGFNSKPILPNGFSTPSCWSVTRRACPPWPSSPPTPPKSSAPTPR